MSDDIVTRAAEVIGKELGYSTDYDGWPHYTMTLDPKHIAQALADANLLAGSLPVDVRDVLDAAVITWGGYNERRRAVEEAHHAAVDRYLAARSET